MVIIPYFFSIDNSHRNDTLNLILFSNFHLVKRIFAIEAGNLLDLLKKCPVNNSLFCTPVIRL